MVYRRTSLRSFEEHGVIHQLVYPHLAEGVRVRVRVRVRARVIRVRGEGESEG